MPSRIRCTTLFDITPTGVAPKRQAPNVPADKLQLWYKQHRQQANYDTILQVISLRSQPEVTRFPVREIVNLAEDHSFGMQYEGLEGDNYAWSFEFDVQHESVFENYDGDLGALLLDCEGVPMLTGLDETVELPQFLDTTPELKNITFEIVEYEEIVLN